MKVHVQMADYLRRNSVVCGKPEFTSIIVLIIPEML